MRIKLTVLYGANETPLVEETDDYDLYESSEDPEGFDEAQGYLLEALKDPYESQGYDLEEESEELGVGVDYLQAYILYDVFDSEQEAKSFAKQFILDAEGALAELE